MEVLGWVGQGGGRVAGRMEGTGRYSVIRSWELTASAWLRVSA